MTINVIEPGRVDKLLADACPQYSRAAITKLFGLGMVRLNGEVVRPGHKVREGAVIEADLSSLDQDQQVVELRVVYEDDDVIVVSKPAGIISHARGRFWYEPSVASFVRWKLTGGDKLQGKVIENAKHTPEGMVTKSYPLKADENGIDRMGIVHRLDRATSGVMVCAKNKKALQFLQKQFADRKVEKTYLAVVSPVPSKNEAIIDAPIERNPKKPSQFRVGPNGKIATTRYNVIDSKNNKALVEFMPLTGRTHQLRVHAKYIGCPIVGDELYGGVPSERLLLHAYTIKLSLPSGRTETFQVPAPEGFEL